MSERFSLNIGIVAALVVALLLIVFSRYAVAQVACPAGTVAITPATQAIAAAAGLPTNTVQCWNPNDPNTGEAAGQAKLWLEQHAVSSANISCLNPQFAEKLEALMQAVPGGVPVITYGYRTIAVENADIKNGSSKLTNACSSYHLYGLAADFNNASAATQQWMRLNAPQYGLSPTGVNPTTGCASSGFCDPGHIQMAGPIPAGSQCGVCNSTGTGVLPGGVASAAASPSIASTVQNPLLTSQPSVTTNPFATTPIASTPVVATQATQACTPQYFCSASTLYYESSSCVTQVFQACQYGCSGTVCTPSPAQTASGSLTVPTATTGSVSSSASATPISTSSTLSLSSGLSVSSQGGLGSQQNPPAEITTIATGSGQEYAPEVGQTTFSSNFSSTPSAGVTTSPLLQLLANLRSVLVSILNHL